MCIRDSGILACNFHHPVIRTDHPAQCSEGTLLAAAARDRVDRAKADHTNRGIGSIQREGFVIVLEKDCALFRNFQSDVLILCQEAVVYLFCIGVGQLDRLGTARLFFDVDVYKRQRLHR